MNLKLEDVPKSELFFPLMKCFAADVRFRISHRNKCSILLILNAAPPAGGTRH